MNVHQKDCILSSVAHGDYSLLDRYLRGDDLAAVPRPQIEQRYTGHFRFKLGTYLPTSLDFSQDIDAYFTKIDQAREQIEKKDFVGTHDKIVNGLVGPVLFNIVDPILHREAALRCPEKSPGEHLERWKESREFNIDAFPYAPVFFMPALEATEIMVDRTQKYFIKGLQFEISTAFTQGVRKFHEDTSISSVIKVYGEKIPFFGVFDGHNGGTTANFLKENITQILIDQLNLLGKPLSQATFAELENTLTTLPVKAEEIRRKLFPLQEVSFIKDSGATFTLALIIEKTVWVANSGDSRILAISDAGEAVQLTEDASPKSQRFSKGVFRRPGGMILNDRVGNYLAVARCVGDRFLPGNTPRAKVTKYSFSSQLLTTLIIGCDGLFERLSSKHIITEYRRKGTVQALIQQAYRSGSCDNICVMAVKIRNS